MKSLGNIGDRIESTGQEFDPVVHEISVMRQIILERVHPFDLLRELVSNAAAKEVGATEILIKYTVDDAGHVFEVKDNGCGMNCANSLDCGTGCTGTLGHFDFFRHRSGFQCGTRTKRLSST